MSRKPFFNPPKTGLRIPVLENIHREIPTQVPAPERAVFHAGNGSTAGSQPVRPGDKVQTGGLIGAGKTGSRPAVSTVTGVVSEVSEHTGYGGDRYTKIVVATEKDDEFDGTFGELIRNPLSRELLPFLDALPGGTDFSYIYNLRSTVRTFIVCCSDREPMVRTNQFMLAARTDELKTGIKKIRKLFRGCRIFVAAPPYLTAMAGTAREEVIVVEPAYPHTLPRMILKNSFGLEVPYGKKIEASGASFISAETLVALAEVSETGTPALNKHLTVIGKDGRSALACARIGTPVGEILAEAGIRPEPGDLLVQGGPMAGRTIHSADTPVLNHTDALFILDKAHVTFSSDDHCINCGECVRACPARMPVNMLVRVLENGLWEEAVNHYDLDACIGCGLCSYVCTARIPVFHHIMLGIHEARRMALAEEADVKG